MNKRNQYLGLSLVIYLCVLIASCDSTEEASPTYEKASPTYQEQEAPKSSSMEREAPMASTPSVSVQQLSEEASSCIDLVKSGMYAEAMEPCQQAIQDTANVEVQEAYEKAKAEVKEAAESSAMDAVKDAASDALRGLDKK